MIVQPDFLDHWKTRKLVKLLKDESAPLILIRLWGFCQQNQKWSLEGIPPESLNSICRVENPRVSVYEMLITCGFIKVRDGVPYVNDWESYNSKLIAAWNNGRSGGRPKNPQVPVGSSDENRLDKIRLDKTNNTPYTPSKEGPTEMPEEVIFWNSLGLGQVIRMSDKRRTVLAARRKEKFFQENWRNAMEAIPKSPFLLGQNDNGWKADFDWFLKPDSVLRIVEGKYQNHQKQQPQLTGI